MFKALVGAFYNWAGLEGASKFLKKYGFIIDSSVFDTKKDNDKYMTLKNLEKIKTRFDQIYYLEFENKEKYVKMVERKTGYRFENPNILLIAFTHKSISKHKRGSMWDDYNLMEYLGDSVIKFFNWERIIKNRNKYIQKKNEKFTVAQKLKFIRIASEK